MQLVVGVPLLFMELSVGQFTSQGPVTAWGMTPLLSGLGWAMVLISAMVCVYYNVIIMYALLYIFLSLVNIGWPVPWASCGNDWNTEDYCRTTALPDLESIVSITERISTSLDIKNQTCIETVSRRFHIGSSKDEIQSKFFNDYNSFESNYSECNIKYTLPSQEYWNYFILSLSDSENIGSIGSVVGRNAMFLLIAWVIIFLCILKGPQSIAKVVYFTATYPLGILVVFLIRGVTTPGYNQGIDYYVIPKWERLLDAEVWGVATLQVLYTVGVCFGGLLTFSSYNKFNNNIFRDAMIVSTINAGTSIFAGFVTFALIGSIAHETNRPVTELVESGPELVFVIYPQGLSTLPSPAMWSFLYFLMVFTLGLDSQFGMMETIVVGVTDRFPDTIGKHRIKFVCVCCVVGFLLGLPLTTKGGIYVLNLFNWYSASYSLMILALVELVMISWIYGVKHFVTDLELMIGKKSRKFWIYWIIMWLFVTPLIIVLEFIFAMISYSPAEYKGKIIPGWAEFIGWMLVMVPVLCVKGRALKMLLYKKIPFLESLKPSKYYGPRYEQNPDDHVDGIRPKTTQEIHSHNDIQIQEIRADTEHSGHSDTENQGVRDSYLSPVHIERGDSDETQISEVRDSYLSPVHVEKENATRSNINGDISISPACGDNVTQTDLRGKTNHGFTNDMADNPPPCLPPRKVPPSPPAAHTDADFVDQTV